MLELQSQAMEDCESHFWKLISGSTRRIRKSASASRETSSKRRRLGIGLGEGIESIRGDSESGSGLDEKFLEVLEKSDFDEELKNLREANKSLYLSMKPEISQLCNILKLEGKSEGLAIKFLEHMMSRLNVGSYSPTMLQALQISLVWSVASLLCLKIDRKQSVALAKQHLDFNCRKYEVEFAYLMLSLFSSQTGKFEAETRSARRLYRYATVDVVQCVDQIKKKCREKMQKLTQKLEEEKKGIICGYEENKLKLQKRTRMESMVIRACCEENSSMRLSKLKSLESSSAKDSEELENKKSMSLKNLESKEQAARAAIQEMEARWLGAVKSLVCPELFGKTVQDEPPDVVELLLISEDSSDDGVDNVGFINPPSAEDTVDMPVKAIQFGVEEMAISGGAKNLVSEDGASSRDRTLDTITPRSEVDDAALNVPENEVQLKVQETLGSTDAVLNLVSADEPPSEDPDTTATPEVVNEMQPEAVCPSADDKVSPTEEQVSEAAISNVSDVEIPSTVAPVPSDGGVVANDTSEEIDEVGVDQQDNPNIAVVQNPPLRELSEINSSSVQPEITLNDGDLVAPNQDQDECTPGSTLSIMQPGEASGANQQNVSEALESPVSQPVDMSAPNQSVNHATLSEPDAQVDVLPSSDPLSRDNNSTGGLPLNEEAPIIERCALNQVPETPTQPDAGKSPVPSPPVILPSPDSALVPSSLPPSVVYSGSRFMAAVSEFINRVAQPVAASGVSPPVYVDPLEKEMEQLSTEFVGVRKSHEDTRLHLQSEREKEIAEALAKINRKYELKQQEIDTKFLSKRNEFGGHYNKVMSSQMLAEAFRSFNSDHTLLQIDLSSQQIALSPPLTGTSSTVSPPVRQQTMPPELNPRAPSLPLSSTSTRYTPPPPPMLATTARNSPPPPHMLVTAFRNTPPPVQTSVGLVTVARNSPLPHFHTAVAPPGAVTIARNSQPHVPSIPVMVAHDTPHPAQIVSPFTASPAAARPLQVCSVSYSNTRSTGSGQMSARATAPPHLRRGSPAQPSNFTSPPIHSQLPASATQRANPFDRITATVELPSIPNLTTTLDSQNGRASQVTPVRFPTHYNLELVANRLNAVNPASVATGMMVNRGSSINEPVDLVYMSDDD